MRTLEDLVDSPSACSPPQHNLVRQKYASSNFEEEMKKSESSTVAENDDAWQTAEFEESPLQFKIEEHIEEVTTRRFTEDESSESELEYCVQTNNYKPNCSDKLYSNSKPYNNSKIKRRHSSCEIKPNIRIKNKFTNNRKSRSRQELNGSRHGIYGHSLESVYFTDRELSSASETNEFERNRIKKSYRRSEAEQLLNENIFSLPILELSPNSFQDYGRVPFPELGVDLIQESAMDDGGPSEVLLDIRDWKENWMFRKEFSNKSYWGIKVVEATEMLIPNPGKNVSPLIGDKNVEELSDFSDTLNFLDISDESSDDCEENVPNTMNTAAENSRLEFEEVGEFAQKDQEYTEHCIINDRLHIFHKPYKDNYNQKVSSNLGETKSKYTAETKSTTVCESPNFLQNKENICVINIKDQYSNKPKSNASECDLQKRPFSSHEKTFSPFENNLKSCQLIQDSQRKIENLNSKTGQNVTDCKSTSRQFNHDPKKSSNNTKISSQIQGDKNLKSKECNKASQSKSTSRLHEKSHKNDLNNEANESRNYKNSHAKQDYEQDTDTADTGIGTYSDPTYDVNTPDSDKTEFYETNLEQFEIFNKNGNFDSAENLAHVRSCKIVDLNENKLKLTKERKEQNIFYQTPKPGTIAEREYSKWLEAEPLRNNPYSAEKLTERLQKSDFKLATRSRNKGTSTDDFSLTEDENVTSSIPTSRIDLSRYSRDYYVKTDEIKSKTLTEEHFGKTSTNELVGKTSTDENFGKILTLTDENFARKRNYSITENNLKENSEKSSDQKSFKVENKKIQNWKDELKDIRLDVSKKVAELQQTIDTCRDEWGKKIQERTSNGRKSHKNKNFDWYPKSKLSSSCQNLSACEKKPSRFENAKRYVVYNSTEYLNQPKGLPSYLWRTVSENTLNKPQDFPSKHSYSSATNTDRYSSKESCHIKSEKRISDSKVKSNNNGSDSDDSITNYRSYALYNPRNYATNQPNSNINSSRKNSQNRNYYEKNKKNQKSNYNEPQTKTERKSNLKNYSTSDIRKNYEFTDYSSEAQAKNSRYSSKIYVNGETNKNQNFPTFNFDSVENLLEDKEKMPSVKLLAQKFDSMDCLYDENKDTSSISTISTAEKEKNCNGYNAQITNKPYKNEVQHSLTARSFSKNQRSTINMKNDNLNEKLHDLKEKENSRCAKVALRKEENKTEPNLNSWKDTNCQNNGLNCLEKNKNNRYKNPQIYKHHLGTEVLHTTLDSDYCENSDSEIFPNDRNIYSHQEKTTRYDSYRKKDLSQNDFEINYKSTKPKITNVTYKSNEKRSLTDRKLKSNSFNYKHQRYPRLTSSPEHLGIPNNPAFIPNRPNYSSTTGDTSDDSSGLGLDHVQHRKPYRKRSYISSMKPTTVSYEKRVTNGAYRNDV